MGGGRTPVQQLPGLSSSSSLKRAPHMPPEAGVNEVLKGQLYGGSNSLRRNLDEEKNEPLGGARRDHLVLKMIHVLQS